MPDINTTCPKCTGTMEEGFITDRTDSGIVIGEWVEGTPERSFWSGVKTNGKKKLAVKTYRCEQCGYLESYAK